MKKSFLLLAAVAMMASCTVTKHSVKSIGVTDPVVSTTIASLEVENTPITYEYVPTKQDSKSLSFKEMLANAQYLALKEHKSGDLLVQVSYSVSAKRICGFLRVKRISVTGYPAKYTKFRTPNEEDRKNIEAFYSIDSKIIAPAEGNNILRIKK